MLQSMCKLVVLDEDEEDDGGERNTARRRRMEIREIVALLNLRVLIVDVAVRIPCRVVFSLFSRPVSSRLLFRLVNSVVNG